MTPTELQALIDQGEIERAREAIDWLPYEEAFVIERHYGLPCSIDGTPALEPMSYPKIDRAMNWPKGRARSISRKGFKRTELLNR